MLKYLGYILFFLMLAFPMALTLLYIKAALFGILLLFTFVRFASTRELALHPRVLFATIALSAVSLGFCIEGMLRGNPGAGQCAQVYVFWPLVYLALLGIINREAIFSGLEKTAICSTAFIGIFGLLFFLSALRMFPTIPFVEKLLPNDELSSGFYSGHVELAFPGLNSLPFLVPFVFTVAVTRERNRVWPWIALVASLPVVLLSGRRALWLVTLLSLILLHGITWFQPRALRRRTTARLLRTALAVGLLASASIAFLGYFSDISWEGMADRFSAGFAFSDSTNVSASARSEQYEALTDRIVEHPFFGAGFGATDFHSVRSEVMPWAYELYYIALIFQTGIVGFGAYTAGMLWIYRTASKMIRNGGGDKIVPAMVGMTAMLIATATNPYLVRFDGIWVIFFPLAILNHWLVQGDSKLSAVFLLNGRSFNPGNA
jgi:hypothetical protein